MWPFSPFSSWGGRLRPDTGLPRKVRTREVGIEEDTEEKVWRGAADLGSSQEGSLGPLGYSNLWVMVEAPQIRELAQGPNKWAKHKKKNDGCYWASITCQAPIIPFILTVTLWGSVLLSPGCSLGGFLAHKSGIHIGNQCLFLCPHVLIQMASLSQMTVTSLRCRRVYPSGLRICLKACAFSQSLHIYFSSRLLGMRWQTCRQKVLLLK